MKLRRLFQLGIQELAGRGRQEAWKRLDRVGLTWRLYSPPSHPFMESVRNRFFEGAVTEDIASFISHLPRARESTIALAEAACEGRFDLLGYRGLRFGNHVDWHLDPVSGRRAPLVHWSRLDPLDPAVVGDSKVVWELNRHQWLVHLGQAYQLTGDERYAEVFADAVREWMRANPPGMGINWASSLEVALRLISWCWALFLFQGSKALTSELLAGMLEGICAHASHVERYLSHYFSPNTHLTGEALGLFYAGVLFTERRPAGRWRELGERILVEQSERQIFPDGVYFEQSTCYQRYTVEIYLHFLILAARNGITVPAEVGERVQRMLDFLLAVRCPDGSIPQIGDADGGWLLPLATRAPDDFRGIFSTAAAFFGRADYAWAAGGPASETLWLLGAEGLETFKALRPAPPSTALFRLFPDGGYAVMRSGWGSDAHHLIFDVGPLGCPVSGGHGHADLLSIQCSAFDGPYLVDSGTYCYTAGREWRDLFRSTSAHSTVVVDGTSQAVPAGPFAWKTRPRARLRRWLSTGALDFADADHDAYRRLHDPVIHRRRVIFVKPRYWVVVDDLDGAAEHRVELRFQFAPIEVTVDPALWARAKGSGGHGLLVRPFATVPLKADVVEGGLEPIQGWASPNYGQRRPAPLLVYSTVTRLPIRVLTLLLPMQEAVASPPEVIPLVSEERETAELVFGNGQETLRFDEHNIVIARAGDAPTVITLEAAC